jgi:hypothetical protein
VSANHREPLCYTSLSQVTPDRGYRGKAQRSGSKSVGRRDCHLGTDPGRHQVLPVNRPERLGKHAEPQRRLVLPRCGHELHGNRTAGVGEAAG